MKWITPTADSLIALIMIPLFHDGYLLFKSVKDPNFEGL